MKKHATTFSIRRLLKAVPCLMDRLEAIAASSAASSTPIEELGYRMSPKGVACKCLLEMGIENIDHPAIEMMADAISAEARCQLASEVLVAIGLAMEVDS